jgi:hypothetical protein
LTGWLGSDKIVRFSWRRLLVVSWGAVPGRIGKVELARLCRFFENWIGRASTFVPAMPKGGIGRDGPSSISLTALRLPVWATAARVD